MRPFIVTGTGRCGTQWMATALRALGYSIGHESVFTPTSLADDTWRDLLAKRGCGSSWLAIARLDEIPPDIAVIQLVREPLAVIRSLDGIEFFDKPSVYVDIARTATGIRGGGAEACAWFWLDANQRIGERADLVVHIEQPREALRAILDLIDPGREVPDRRLESIVRSLPTNLNGRARSSAEWVDIPEPLRNDIQALAREFGYEA